MVEPEKYPGTSTFINLLKIRDPRDFSRFENGLSAKRVFEILDSSETENQFLLTQSIDFSYIKNLHKYIFQDLYAWAGEIRSYEMALRGDIFTPYKDIEEHGNNLIQEIKDQDFLLELDTESTINALARYSGLLNMIHPFPDGNGRTQSAFINLLARNASFSLDWTKVQKWENIETARRAHHEQDFLPLRNLLKKIIS